MAGRNSDPTLKDRFRAVLNKIDARVPPGLRLILGLVLVAGGVLGFLPVLGFWMIPLGLAVMALDIPPLRNRIRGKERKEDD